MRNVFLIHLETKVALIIIFIAVVIFLIVVSRSFISFNKFIDEVENRSYEEIRIQKSQ